MSGPGANRLPVLANEIRRAHAGVEEAARTAAERAIEAGTALIEAKKLVKHGEWRRWLKENCALPERTAQFYMRLARLGLNPQRVADLSLRTLAQVQHVITDESYDPFAHCDADGKRQWLLFVLHGRAWEHVEWLLQKQFTTPDEWLGPDGAAFRKRCWMREPSDVFKAHWAEFQAQHRDLSLADIERRLAGRATP